MDTKLAVFDHSVEKTNRFLKEVEEELDCSRQTAYSLLRAVMHAVRDRITVEEAAHFASQLPMLMRGVFFEGWKPSATPQSFSTRDEFIAYAQKKMEPAGEMLTEDAARVVLAVISRHVSDGQAAQICHMLPGDIQQLWPEQTRTAA